MEATHVPSLCFVDQNSVKDLTKFSGPQIEGDFWKLVRADVLWPASQTHFQSLVDMVPLGSHSRSSSERDFVPGFNCHGSLSVTMVTDSQD